jgi:ADP-heptose:LPS heptosyltransferase
MSVITKINTIRRNLLRRMTRNVGISPVEVAGPISLIDIQNVLICRPNARLGNLVLCTPLVQEVAAIFPNAKIDLFVKGHLAPVVFENYDEVRRVIQLPKKPFRNMFKYFRAWATIKRNRYDLVINVDGYSSSGRLSAKFANANFKSFGEVTPELQSCYPDHQHMAKFPVYALRLYLRKLGLEVGGQPVAPLHLKLSTLERADGKRILSKLAGNDRKTICLFTYATGSKIYPEVWWKNLYERLRNEFPDFNIVEILPIENVSQIAFAAPAFYSKDIREIAAVIANAVLFIGADSGMMHVASSAQTTTIGLFKRQNVETYKPYGNHSLGIHTANATLDDCLNVVKGILARRSERQSSRLPLDLF